MSAVADIMTMWCTSLGRGKGVDLPLNPFCLYRSGAPERLQISGPEPALANDQRRRDETRKSKQPSHSSLDTLYNYILIPLLYTRLGLKHGRPGAQAHAAHELRIRRLRRGR